MMDDNGKSPPSPATPAPLHHVMGSVPTGYALVPIEPNDKMMLMGGFSFAGKMPNDEVFPAVRNIWSKMLSKAPDVEIPKPVQVGWMFDGYVGDDEWNTIVQLDKPSEGPCVRNLTPIYALSASEVEG